MLFDEKIFVGRSATVLDGSNIRALKCAARAKNPDIIGDNGWDRYSCGFDTKIHLATDAGGLQLNIMLCPRQARESQFAPLDGIGVMRQNDNMKRRGHTAL